MQEVSCSVAEDRLDESASPKTEAQKVFQTEVASTAKEIAPPQFPKPKRPNARAPHTAETSVWWFVFLGVVLPVVTIGFEILTRACAQELFDPMPSWLHVFLLALVPAGNACVAASIKQRRVDRLRWLAPLQAFILGITAAYALIFLPLTPFAAIAVIFYGIGLIPLTPLLAFVGSIQGLYKLKTLAHQEGRKMPRVWPAVLASLVILAISPLHALFTHWAISLTTSTDKTAAQRGLWMLRTFGSDNHLLRACYGGSSRNWINWPPEITAKAPGTDVTTSEIARSVYYRVTGQPYNSVPAPSGKTIGSSGRGTWNFDAGLGGTKVANRIAGLSMIGSRLDGKADVAAGTSYLEWTMVFKNVARNQSEARAQIELPPGAAVSRLTLWIDGQPCEAAFGGRSQVRAAYQEVAVAQRRDPVLVTTSGPNRVLMQCFPVQPNGGEMKVRVGITAPLQIVDGTRSEMLLPRMLEWNFEHDSGMSHELWLESDQPLSVSGKGSGQVIRQQLSDTDLQKSPRITAERIAASEIWSEDPTDPTFAIRQVIRQRKAQAPGRVIFLVDGSKVMRPHLGALSKALAQLSQQTEFSVVFAGDEVETPWEGVRRASAEEVKAAAAWLEGRKATGGRENLAALLGAWDLAATSPGSAIVWVHGPQPILLGTAEALLQRRERDRTPPHLYDISVGSGPNRILEQLDGFEGLHPVRFGADPAEAISRLLSLWNGTTPEWHAERQRIPRPNNFDALAKTDRHLARLWGAEEVDRLRLTPEEGSLDQAIKLALQLQLVTPVSGAVVLERAEQYERHGLKPGDPANSPTVPEPTTGALLAIAAGAYAGMRRWRKPRC